MPKKTGINAKVESVIRNLLALKAGTSNDPFAYFEGKYVFKGGSEIDPKAFLIWFKVNHDPTNDAHYNTINRARQRTLAKIRREQEAVRSVA